MAAEDALNTCAACFNDLSNTEPVLYRSLLSAVAESVPVVPPEGGAEVGTGTGTAASNPDALCPACQRPVDEAVDTLCPSCFTPIPPVLMLVVGERRERLRSGDVLGRAGTVATDIFSPILEVSRQHARILARDGAWIVEALSSSNVTRLDGKVIGTNAVAQLTGRHRLSMSSRCEVVLELTGSGETNSADTGL